MNKLFFILLLFSSLLYAQEKTERCASCHGLKGLSSNPTWPNLAGQNTRYFTKQIHDMQIKQRDPGLMVGIINTLSSQDIGDLAAYYAKMPVVSNQTKKTVQRGEALYRRGDSSKGIIACIACHGPKGRGNKQAGFPLLAGQHADYTITQLIAFKEKKRTNDLNHVMQDISAKLTKEDIDALAHYIHDLY